MLCWFLMICLVNFLFSNDNHNANNIRMVDLFMSYVFPSNETASNSTSVRMKTIEEEVDAQPWKQRFVSDRLFFLEPVEWNFDDVCSWLSELGFSDSFVLELRAANDTTLNGRWLLTTQDFDAWLLSWLVEHQLRSNNSLSSSSSSSSLIVSDSSLQRLKESQHVLRLLQRHIDRLSADNADQYDDEGFGLWLIKVLSWLLKAVAVVSAVVFVFLFLQFDKSHALFLLKYLAILFFGPDQLARFVLKGLLKAGLFVARTLQPFLANVQVNTNRT